MEKVRLTLFLTNEQNPYLQMVKADAIQAAERAGMAIDVAFAGNQAIAQIQQIYTALREEGDSRPRAVLVMPVFDDALARVARATVAAGVGWVSLFRRSSYLDELRRANPAIPVSMVSPDQPAIGQIQGKQIRALLPRGGRILFVKGMQSSSSTHERFAATEQALKGSGIEAGGVVDGNWAEEDAAREVGRWLRLLAPVKDKRVDLIACQNDSMAQGALDAVDAVATSLQRPDLRDLPIVGADGLPDVGRKLVDQGRLAATIVLPSPAATAVQLLRRAFQGGGPPPPEVLLESSGYPDESVLAARVRSA
jgi:ABC-type sugar transport system substrate-binding protein